VLDFIFGILKNITGAIGNGAGWIWDHMVPNSVKDKLKFKIDRETFMFAASHIFSLFRHWYFYMTIAGVYVAYRLFEALENSGILARFTATVESTMKDIFRIADVCFPLIGNLKDMLRCIGIK
jgi:hypothetical protein